MIEKMLKQENGVRAIARTLERAVSTVSEEIRRNGGTARYNAERASHRAYLKQYRKKRDCNAVAMDSELSRYVEKRLEHGWSPETISIRIKNKGGVVYASNKSIRKYIKKRNGLERFLFWNRHHKKSGRKRKKFVKLGERRFIDERPVTALYEYGNWEGDFIVSNHTTDVLLVLVERKTKFSLLRCLPNRNNSIVNDAIVSMLEGYTVQSLTLDNDIAFAHWRELEQRLDTTIFFTHPYHSWEKGLVENINRWIRQFVPKRTNLRLITHDGIRSIHYWLNNVPRQCLSGNTSYENMISYEKKVKLSSLLVPLPENVGCSV